MENELKKTKNYYRAIGVVNETNFTREACEIKLKDKDGNDEGVMKGERIRGDFTVRCDDGLHNFRVFFQSHNSKPDKNGNRENSRWKMAESMMEWNPEIGGNGEEPTLVSVSGTIDINDYVGQDGEVKSVVVRNVGQASTKVNLDEPHACTWEGNAYIKSITHEVINDEETGRLVVQLLGVNSRSEVFPIKAVVEEDMAEDFEDAFDVEQTVPMTIDVVVRHVGSKKQTKKAFGKAGKLNVNNGFDITEYIIVAADYPIEEPEVEDEDGNLIENGYLDPKTMKKALREREKKLSELKANGSVATKRGNSFKEQKKAVAVGTRKPKAVDMDDEDDFDPDLPF